MKCQATVDGKVCGTDVPLNNKFCPECGSKVLNNDYNSTRHCPKCSSLVAIGQKFCTSCGWKVDTNIFEQKKILCKGLLDGNPCGAELSPSSKFCQECGTKQRNLQSKGQEENVPDSSTKPNTESQPNADDESEQQRDYTQLGKSSESESSSGSESPDRWKPPNSSLSTPESEDNKDGETAVNAKEAVEERDEHDAAQNDEMVSLNQDSEDKLTKHELEENSSVHHEAESRSPDGDIVNNKSEGLMPMEIDPTSTGQTVTYAENSQTVNTESRETLTQESIGKPNPITQSLTEQQHKKGQGVTMEKKNQTSLVGNNNSKDDSLVAHGKNQENVGDKNIFSSGIKDDESDNEHPSREGDKVHEPEGLPGNAVSTSEDIATHSMTTSDKPPSTGQGQVKELTKQSERSILMESNERNVNEHDKLKRGMSQSSEDISMRGSEDETDSESSSGEEEEEEKKDQASGQQQGKGRRNKTRAKRRQKKRERKERNLKRKLNLPDTDPDTDSKKQGTGSISKSSEKGRTDQKTKDKQNITDNITEQTGSKDAENGSMSRTSDEPDMCQTGTTIQSTKDRPSSTDNSTGHKGSEDNEDNKGHAGVADDGDGEGQRTKSSENENQSYNLRSGAKNKDNQQQGGDKKTSKGETKSSESTSGKDTTNKGKGQKRTEISEVYFHILVSPTLLADHNKERVYIHFHASALGGWKSRNHELKFKSKHTDGFLQYEGFVRISKELLWSPLLYSYYVVRSGNDVVDEYIYCHSSESKNRTLKIVREKIRDTIHQFDGVIKEKPETSKGMIKMVKGLFGVDDYKKELKKEACFAFRVMAPQVQLSMAGTSGITGEEILFYFDSLIDGLETTYHITAGLWYDKRGFMSALTKDIHEYINQQLLRIEEHRKIQKEEDGILILSAAIALFTIKDLNDVDLTDTEDEFLCRALLPSINNKRICPEYEGLKGYFPNTRKKITSSLLCRVKKFAGESTKTCWLFCVPLLHFLLDRCQPYQLPTPKVNHDDVEPEWWGIVGLGREIDYFKYKSKWDRKKNELLQVLEPYFTVDYLLPRTFMACLSLHHVLETVDLELLPTDAILATLFFYIKTNNYLGKESLKGIRKTFLRLTTRLLKMSEDPNLPIEYALRNFKIASNLMDQLYPKFFDDKTIICLFGVEVVFVAIAWFTQCLKKRQEEGKLGNYKEHMACFEKHRGHIKYMLCNEYFFGYEEQFLRVWNEALKLKIPNGEVKDVYVKYIRDELEEVLTTRSSGVETKIVQLYCENLESYCDPVQEILSKLAYKAVEKGASIQYTGTGMRGTTLTKYGHLLSTVFERSMDVQHMVGYHKILSYCLNWAPFSLYVKIFYHSEYSKSLSEQSSALMSNFLEVLKKTSEDVIRGTILIQDLQEILGKFEHFKSVVMEVKDLPIKAEYLIAALPMRDKELLAYQKTLKIVQDFVYMCNRFGGNTDSLEEKIKRYDHLDNVSLNMLCKIGMLEDMKNKENYQPLVTAFGLEDHVLQTIPYILGCGKSILFMTLWDKKGQEQGRLKGKLLDIEEILEEVWQPTYKFWTDLRKRLQTGDLKFSEFEKYFKTTHLDTLEEELVKLSTNGDTRWVKVRLDQLQKYRSLRSCLYGAQVIIDVVRKYELKGDFEQILEISNLAQDADTKMNTLDDSMMKTCEILSGIDEKKANCLKNFCQCKDLVDWLRVTMPSGLKELKVFVDLASISAGEGDYEIGKVNCLHSATTGYAPLIFNLDGDCGAVAFLGKCQEVWKELASNPTLPKKLTDTQRQLDWLKSVKQTHGSVEVTSLAQAEAINANGIYQVGNLKKTAAIKNPTLSAVLELKVTETEGQKSQRNQYRYDQLHDLQSRLMLVAGKAEKGKDEVDRFMLILDSVVRLGNIYTKLVAEGCVLFSQWHVRFLCDPNRTACAFINFGFGEEKHTLKGRINQQGEDVSAIIPKLAKFMEQCHQKWLDYIDERREKFYLLNYFTIDQMVILQQELVKIGSEVEPSVLIYPMLSAVRQGCTKEDLVKAMTSAKQDVETLDARREQEMEEGGGEDEMESEDTSDDVKVAKFLKVVTEIYSIELAREALKHVSPDEIDEGLEWCMENEDDFIPDNTNEDTPMEDDRSRETTRFTGWTETGQSLASITANLVSQLGMESKENSVDKLIRALEDLWQTFLSSISSSVSDYLSVEHLGLILNRLAEQEEMIIDRTFLPSFTPGEPNLIICPQSEIYNTVLTVYSHENDKSLPQHDEVLLCTPQTTLDMVEIFWRRALFADNKKVYCLVNADLLDYDVSDRGERTLERLMKNAENRGIKYKLVVICSSENEYKSRIVAALDKFHRPQLPIDVKNVREYLLTKLRVDKAQSGMRPASSVDFEKCSVRVVKSWRAGVGKTLYKKRMVTDLYKVVPNIPRRFASNVTIPLHEKAINTDSIMDILLEETLPPRCNEPRIFHIDISHEVQDGVDAFLFQLLVLGCLGHGSGHVWRKTDLDYYIIESMPLLIKGSDSKLKCLHHCLDILPHVLCRSPQESLEILADIRRPPDYSDHDRLFDIMEFKSTTFQRPFQYLKRLDTNCKLDDVNAHVPEGDKKQCLKTLLRHCGVKDPSWSELHHFVSFLNKQLEDFNGSAFCSLAAMEDLPGFAKFVLRFLIQMSRDFSTRSLKVSEESPIQLLQRQISDDDDEENREDDNIIQQYQMRRKWETSPHPYLFFNPDHHSMTFLGFNIDRRTGNLIDQQTRDILEQGIMQQNLFDALVRNSVNLAENFDALPRADKILKLCNVMGLDMIHDPDDTYELTTDNVKKILAIYMRFRCEIPVIIMGETGCGKTRLIKFMCSLQQPPGVTVENMILMKVHGGTRVADIVRKVKKAEEIAQKNAADYPFMDTVLFFDEANTTEAIGVIKEIMCDKSLCGKPIKLHEKLKIVAACNPYRKHSDELIQRLEQAGLGYHVDADKTTDKLGRVPMRRLVYRVQPLPQSMLPLVWDFGQLNTEVETMYIRQMVLRYIKNDKLPALQGLEDVVSKILTVSQDFMRDQKDECSFVSLRDVERVLEVMSWFYEQSEEDNLLFRKMKDESLSSADEDEDEEMEVAEPEQTIDDITRSLVLALGVCYHACLKNRDEYRKAVAGYFRPPLVLPKGADQIKDEISNCQTVFLENVELAANIAKNQALKENVFMMIVCIELRIPMFLVGKPGSSKSLAKTIVADAMQGNAAHKDLFKNYKQAQMVSYQCSPISVPEGIVGTFRQCAAYQKDKDLGRFVSIVVLDEIGLAEDSPRMPLKTLHPLLEDGCPDDEDPEPYKKVAFIGISNWALDPAKMNRGILVQREVPDITELKESAEGICSTNEEVLKLIKPMIEPMADSYLELFGEASKEMREFFGLRDFYSLLKMLYAFVSLPRIPCKPTWLQLKHAILRNFGGLEKVDPVNIFYSKLSKLVNKHEERREDDPDCTSAGMIQACLTGDSTNSESRYLLLLTENYGALTILQQKIFTMHNAVIIFGSSFPSDQEYTQVCRNINRIKVCMETGSTVILLNLENLYESLYDALNQYYVEFGGERYVDLGLGTHRVKCRVHRNFRLIVVAEKQIVYNKFPIPLINRLEKHFLSLKTMLTPTQLEMTEKLQNWAQRFCEARVPAYMRKQKESRKIGDAFMGYHADTCAAIILHVCQEKRCDDSAIPQIEKEILHDAKSMLLWCATPASVWQLEDLSVFNTYFVEQHHDSLADYLHYKIVTENKGNIYAQITTNSKLMSTADVEVLCKFIPVQKQNVTLLTLQSFDTEQQFSRQLKSSFDQKGVADMLLIVQCDCGDQNADLVACARYTVQGELQQVQEDRIDGIHVVFLIQLPGIAGGCFSGFQCGLWHSVHIDELQPAPDEIPSISEMHGKSVSDLLAAKQQKKHVQMDIDREPILESDEPMETREPVELMDIELEEATPDRIFKPKRQFNVSYLIEKCIQPALGNVKDPASDSNRALNRLKIVLNYIKDSRGNFNFMSGITKHLSSILVEKEQSSSLVTNWLSAEASKPENINRAGTFRRFAVHCLESKVIPLLAGIVAFIDTNRNIDILTENVGWKTDIWMQIFNNPELTQLRYEFIVSPTRHQELEEVLVKTTSMEGRAFSSIMPFSWLIFQMIDEVLRNTLKRSDVDEGIPFRKDTHLDIVIRATETFEELPLGRMLSTIEGTYIHDILKAYIVDFVHMVHPVQSQEECDLVCESVVIGCKHLIQREYGRLLISLVGCHMAFILHDTRFKNFSHIVHVWPNCCKKMIEFQKKESNFYLVTEDEMTFDILALHLLMDHLEPNKEALNKQDTRTKWLRQVCDYRPIIERIIGHFNQDTENKEFHYGDMCKKGVEQARNQWTRSVVVKLFIEHVCSVGKDGVDITQCMLLWTTFRDGGADLKDIRSLEKVEKFLNMCNRFVVKKCFGDQMECVSCESKIEGAPVRLPCDHILCRRCFFDCLTLKEFVCQNCDEKFPHNLDPDKSDNEGAIKKFLDYRRRCNSFFMEVVSQLCFAEGTPPSQQVIEKLLSYILGRTKKVERVISRELTIFNDSIDPTPVVRSFLLQQLMQTSNHEIENHLQAYFNYADQLVSATGDSQQLIELSLLINQCMEDFLHQQNANRDDEIVVVTGFLRDACPYIASHHTELLDKIEYISRVRFSLSVVAKYTHKLYGSTQSTMPDPMVRKMFDQAAKLCEECGSQWPRRYFVKQLCRCYGIDSYQTVSKNNASFLRWVRLPELRENRVKECHDRYIVMGDEYKELRETVVTTVLNENGEKLQQLLQNPPNEWQIMIKLLLALHREITMNNVYGDQPKKFSDKGKNFIQQYIASHAIIKNKEVAQRILTNMLWRIPGNIDPGMDLADQNIACLLTHYFILMSQIPGKTTLLSPLQRIALDPLSMVTSFYPTMPQDELAEIKEAVLAARQQNPGENSVFYRCPNGHPYVIGDCGRPTTVVTCKACGREIGGERYNLRPGNELNQGRDRTETGHILGRATGLGPITAPERKLSRPAFAILRLLTHVSMYVGANLNKQAICQSVKPNIREEEVATYLMEHINLDLASIQNVLGKNKDDILVLMHFLLARVMNEHTMRVISEAIPPNICSLVDKGSRAKWEEDFSKRYIDPVLQDMENIIKANNTQILNDKRLGSDPLLQILYETDKTQEGQDINMLHEVPAVWRYRAMITVNHLRQHMDADNRKLSILRLFLKEEHHLRAIRFVPSIIRLQKMLIQKYNKKLDRAEATTMKVEDVRRQMRQDRRSKEFGSLLDDYVEAWNCVRESLENYVCPANEVLVTVDEKYCRTEITEKTPISHLIPTHKDAGLSSYVLLFFLLKKQNNFLQNYCSKCKLKEDSLPKVHVKDISSAHLISYHPDRDLLPMVLANCNYSFEVGQGTTVEYNFTNLERQLMDRFLFSKSIVNSIQEIETITYRSESTNGVVLKSLCNREIQERLNPAVVSQICSEVRLKSYPDLCESLDKLDIAISFLKSVGANPDNSLYDFMANTLKIDSPFPSTKAQQAARCKHTMSLWITLALERAKALAKYKKKAFESVSDNFKKILTDEQIQAIEDVITRLPTELIDILVDVVFECIVLKVDVPQNADDEDFVDMSKVCLRDTLIGYVDSCPFQGDLTLDDALMETIHQLPSEKENPQRILTAHSVEVWCLLNKIFTSKQKQR